MESDGMPGSRSTGDADSAGAWVRNWRRSIVALHSAAAAVGWLLAGLGWRVRHAW